MTRRMKTMRKTPSGEMSFVCLRGQYVNLASVKTADFYSLNGQQAGYVKMLDGSILQVQGAVARRFQKALRCHCYGLRLRSESKNASKL